MPGQLRSAATSMTSLDKKPSWSSSSSTADGALIEELGGTHKVKYNAGEEWDFLVESTHKPIDLTLAMPHYRARHQPIDHRMNMFIGSHDGPVKAKVCRTTARSYFYLEVQASTSDVTVWLPSDFRGHILHIGKASFSAGFVNRIMANVRINEKIYPGEPIMDEVVVCTTGQVMFRMWDIATASPENRHKEGWKRMFACAKRSPETSTDWDFLLED